jgi:hypothetical protein
MDGSLNQKLECRSIVHKTSLNSYDWVCEGGNPNCFDQN